MSGASDAADVAAPPLEGVKVLDLMWAMAALQAARVAAHIVQNSPEFTVDPQIVHRQHFIEVPHAKQGTTTVENTRFVMSLTPAQVTSGGSTLGEHTFEVLTETLAYDDGRIAELAIAELLE